MAEKKKKIFLLHTVVLLCAFLMFAGLYAYTRYVNSRPFTVDVSQTNDYDVQITRPKEWSETAHGYLHGMQYDVEIYNRTYGDAYDWIVKLYLINGCHVDSYWNGDMVFENNIITLTSADYNDTIKAGDKQTFGFILYSNSLDNVKATELTVHRRIEMAQLPLFWVIIVFLAVYAVVNITMAINEARIIALREKQREFLSIINESLLTFANMIDAKDPYTKGHSQRVAIYSKELAARMGMDKDAQRNLFYIALLHDIGKIGIADSILKKADKLTPEERKSIEEHVQIGGDILKDFSAIDGIEEGARYHHERYDGNGYVDGLKGMEIPVYARIICVADAFDAMSSARCYRPKLEMDVIISELQVCSGTQFDPEIVPHMLAMIAEGKAPVTLDAQTLYRELDIE